MLSCKSSTNEENAAGKVTDVINKLMDNVSSTVMIRPRIFLGLPQALGARIADDVNTWFT